MPAEKVSLYRIMNGSCSWQYIPVSFEKVTELFNLLQKSRSCWFHEVREGHKASSEGGALVPDDVLVNAHESLWHTSSDFTGGTAWARPVD